MCSYIIICEIHMLILFHMNVRKQQHMDRLEFCGSPTGLDLRDPFDLHVGEFLICLHSVIVCRHPTN